MDSENGIHLISDIIQTLLKIDVSVLMGANIAKDVAREDFCECTIGMINPLLALCKGSTLRGSIH